MSLKHLVVLENEDLQKNDKDMSKEHTSQLEGAPSHPIGDNLSIKMNNDNSRE